MFRTSHIEISRSALKHNLDFIRNMIGDHTKFSSVVKGNAYGHGIEQFVPLAEDCGVNHFSVFSASEAYRVSKLVSTQTEIMIMGMMQNPEVDWAIEKGIEFYVFDMDRLEHAKNAAQKMGLKALVHIELETGMNRTGFSTRQLPGVLNYIRKNNDHLEFSGLCTHFAGAESIANYHRVKRQVNVFSRAYARTTKSGMRPNLKHTACSAASIRYPNTRMDMVRIGILQYGFFPSREVLIHFIAKNKDPEYPLKRVISWKSTIMSIKTVKTGEFIGYGTSYLANNDMTVATVPVGYSQGFSRSLSNQGRVLIHGHRVSVIGTVNMNMMTVDITNLEGVQKGDEVALIGTQDDLEISVASFSEFSDQLNYELLTRLPHNIQRNIVE